ncbi:hypothetical protein TNCV_1634241 [Trichonephila clavipes]|nr:hypothetical protein TNCV_1634241 [Trichonephila clavipes]
MADRRVFMLGSRSLLLDKRLQASRRSFEAGILTSRKVYSEESEWKSESSYWLMKSEDNGCPCAERAVKFVLKLLSVEQKNFVLQCYRIYWFTIDGELDSLRLLAISKMKMTLKGYHLWSRDEIRQNATMELNTIPKEAFQKRYDQPRDKCVVRPVTEPIDSCWLSNSVNANCLMLKP